MKKNIKTILISSILTLLLILLLKESNTVIESVQFSLSIWVQNLIPSLFPFLIISFFLMNYGISDIFSECIKPFVTNILHLPASCGFTFIASVLSGFPSNAKFIKEQLDKKEISLEDANDLLAFCYFPSPLFVIGTIGIMLLGSKKIGIMMLFSYYLGSIILAYCIRKNKKGNFEKRNFRKCIQKVKQKINHSEEFALVLKEAIASALNTLFLLLGIITIFLILTNLITKVLSITSFEKTALSSILEMTQGVKNISMLAISPFYQAILMLATISFGGCSIHCQIWSMMDQHKISYQKFLFARVLHIIFSCTIFIGLYQILGS